MKALCLPLVPATTYSLAQPLCLLSHSHPSQSHWQQLACFSRTKNMFPSFFGTSSELPENMARFWNPIPQCQGFPLWFQRKREMGVLWLLLHDIMKKTVQWPVSSILRWGGRWSCSWPVSQWVQGLNARCGWRTQEVEPELKNHLQSGLIWQSKALNT